MIEVKFHKGPSKIYGVSLEKFVEATKETGPYIKIGAKGKEAFGICPLCENPVKLLGIYAKLEKQRNHARHYKHDIQNLAEFNEYKYLKCPYHRERADYVSEIRRPEEMTSFNVEILTLAHDYFDKCIYILRKVTGLVISTHLAEQIAMDYMAHPGFMTYDITRENVPYIMGLCMTGKNLIKRVIEKDSPLYEMLKNKEEVSLVLLSSNSQYRVSKPLYRIESNVGYLELAFNISRYRFVSNQTSNLKEYLKLHIGIPDGEGTYKTYAEKEIEVDPFFFNKLIHSSKALKPKQEMIDIANQILKIKER